MSKIFKKNPTADEIAEMADKGEDITKFFTGNGKMKPPLHKNRMKRVNVDFTPEMLHELDSIAREVNISRQATIKMYLRQAINQHYLAKRASQSLLSYIRKLPDMQKKITPFYITPFYLYNTILIDEQLANMKPVSGFSTLNKFIKRGRHLKTNSLKTFLDIIRSKNYCFYMMLKISNIIIFVLLVLSGVSYAVEPALRITDREIVERLTRIEAGQEALNQRLEASHEALSQRIDDLSQRITGTNNTMLALFGAMITILVAMFAYIAWDRRTMLKPVAVRLEQLEKDMYQELDLTSPEGSKLNRLIHAMRELARTDENVASVLRSFSLL